MESSTSLESSTMSCVSRERDGVALLEVMLHGVGTGGECVGLA